MSDAPIWLNLTMYKFSQRALAPLAPDIGSLAFNLFFKIARGFHSIPTFLTLPTNRRLSHRPDHSKPMADSLAHAEPATAINAKVPGQFVAMMQYNLPHGFHFVCSPGISHAQQQNADMPFS